MSSTPTKTIITAFASMDDFTRLMQNNPGLVIVKFGASWCGPCKRIQSQVHDFFAHSPDNVVCCDIDVDESFDVYTYFKRKRMIVGVPTLMCFRRGNMSYIPDESVANSDPAELHNFFTRCGLMHRALPRSTVKPRVSASGST